MWKRVRSQGGGGGGVERFHQTTKISTYFFIACEIHGIKREVTRNRDYSLLLGPLHVVILSPSKVVC